jgi:hypothetical protein
LFEGRGVDSDKEVVGFQVTRVIPAGVIIEDCTSTEVKEEKMGSDMTQVNFQAGGSSFFQPPLTDFTHKKSCGSQLGVSEV